jgi:hypothetical protein
LNTNKGTLLKTTFFQKNQATTKTLVLKEKQKLEKRKKGEEGLLLRGSL